MLKIADFGGGLKKNLLFTQSGSGGSQAKKGIFCIAGLGGSAEKKGTGTFGAWAGAEAGAPTCRRWEASASTQGRSREACSAVSAGQEARSWARSSWASGE